MSTILRYPKISRPLASSFPTLIALLIACLSSGGCETQTTGLKQSVARANETAALAALHSIAIAQQTYSVSNEGKYATFQQLADSSLLNGNISPTNPEVTDYVLTMEVNDKPGYSCKADPKDKPGRHFYIDSTSREMRVNLTQPATDTDPTYQP